MSFDAKQAQTDAALLAAFAQGDKGAAHDLTQRLLPLAYGQAMRMLQNSAQAEDVAQEAMLRLWKAAPNWEPGKARASTWLYQVVSNLCIDILRKAAPASIDEIAEPTDPVESASDRLQNLARANALKTAIGSLPERQAQAVSLRHLEGCSNPEIADIMDLKVEAVESLIARGKRRMVQLLSPRKAELGFTE